MIIYTAILSICNRMGCYLEKRFYKMFSESSTVVLQLPYCPGRQGNSQKIIYKTSFTSNTFHPTYR